MGLSSLPLLNKLGHNTHWQNSIFTEKFNSIYSNKQSTINTLTNVLTTERFFFTYCDKLKNAKLHRSLFYDSRPIKHVEQKSYNYCGEVWFLSYTNFIIISPFVFNSSIIDKKKIKLKLNSDILVLFYLSYWDIL